MPSATIAHGRSGPAGRAGLRINLPGVTALEIPKAIGPFELRQKIGHGTYGEVFEGFDPKREVRAAVKLFDKAPRGEKAFARLRRDAEAAGALGHPNIATVLGVGIFDGIPWVATELVAGVSLAQVVRSRTVWPIHRVLDVWRQLCEGLAHAHREGLLHLDLKPTDVRVSSDGDVKVVDFGAWHVKTLERRHPGPADESLHYRPPEVVAGKRPDCRADIFAVAAMMYELITRRKAFPGDVTTDVIRSLSHCEPDLATLPSSPFSPGIERILSASLARDPSARPASFEEVHADLVQLVRETAPRLRVSEQESGDGASGSAPEGEGLLAELTRARADDRLEDALDVCRKLLALDSNDELARRSLSEVESVMVGREADELVGEALALAADGEIERATRLAQKVERLAPWSPRYLELQVYLDEEQARRAADRLVGSARAHKTEGRLEEARAAIREALAAMPWHAAANVLLEELGGQEGAESPEEVAAKPDRPPSVVNEEPPEAAPREPATTEETPGEAEPEPENPPQPDEAPDPAPEPEPVARTPAEPSPAAPADPDPGIQSAPDRAEALTVEALACFTANEHQRARAALDRALELDPANRRAQELRRILRVLG
jgi:serine/threonine protein kinase